MPDEFKPEKQAIKSIESEAAKKKAKKLEAELLDKHPIFFEQADLAAKVYEDTSRLLINSDNKEKLAAQKEKIRGGMAGAANTGRQILAAEDPENAPNFPTLAQMAQNTKTAIDRLKSAAPVILAVDASQKNYEINLIPEIAKAKTIYLDAGLTAAQKNQIIKNADDALAKTWDRHNAVEAAAVPTELRPAYQNLSKNILAANNELARIKIENISAEEKNQNPDIIKVGEANNEFAAQKEAVKKVVELSKKIQDPKLPQEEYENQVGEMLADANNNVEKLSALKNSIARINYNSLPDTFKKYLDTIKLGIEAALKTMAEIKIYCKRKQMVEAMNKRKDRTVYVRFSGTKDQDANGGSEQENEDRYARHRRVKANEYFIFRRDGSIEPTENFKKITPPEKQTALWLQIQAGPRAEVEAEINNKSAPEEDKIVIEAGKKLAGGDWQSAQKDLLAYINSPAAKMPGKEERLDQSMAMLKTIAQKEVDNSFARLDTLRNAVRIKGPRWFKSPDDKLPKQVDENKDEPHPKIDRYLEAQEAMLRRAGQMIESGECLTFEQASQKLKTAELPPPKIDPSAPPADKEKAANDFERDKSSRLIFMNTILPPEFNAVYNIFDQQKMLANPNKEDREAYIRYSVKIARRHGFAELADKLLAEYYAKEILAAAKTTTRASVEADFWNTPGNEKKLWKAVDDGVEQYKKKYPGRQVPSDLRDEIKKRAAYEMIGLAYEKTVKRIANESLQSAGGRAELWNSAYGNIIGNVQNLDIHFIEFTDDEWRGLLPKIAIQITAMIAAGALSGGAGSLVAAGLLEAGTGAAASAAGGFLAESIAFTAASRVMHSTLNYGIHGRWQPIMGDSGSELFYSWAEGAATLGLLKGSHILSGAAGIGALSRAEKFAFIAKYGTTEGTAMAAAESGKRWLLRSNINALILTTFNAETAALHGRDFTNQQALVGFVDNFALAAGVDAGYRLLAGTIACLPKNKVLSEAESNGGNIPVDTIKRGALVGYLDSKGLRQPADIYSVKQVSDSFTGEPAVQINRSITVTMGDLHNLPEPVYKKIIEIINNGTGIGNIEKGEAPIDRQKAYSMLATKEGIISLEAILANPESKFETGLDLFYLRRDMERAAKRIEIKEAKQEINKILYSAKEETVSENLAKAMAKIKNNEAADPANPFHTILEQFKKRNPEQYEALTKSDIAHLVSSRCLEGIIAGDLTELAVRPGKNMSVFEGIQISPDNKTGGGTMTNVAYLTAKGRFVVGAMKRPYTTTEAATMFKYERDAAMQTILWKHPNIIKPRVIGEDFIIYETSAHCMDYITALEKLGTAEVMRLQAEAFRAENYIENKHQLNADIKGRNILIMEVTVGGKKTWIAKLIDISLIPYGNVIAQQFPHTQRYAPSPDSIYRTAEFMKHSGKPQAEIDAWVGRAYANHARGRILEDTLYAEYENIPGLTSSDKKAIAKYYKELFIMNDIERETNIRPSKMPKFPNTSNLRVNNAGTFINDSRNLLLAGNQEMLERLISIADGLNIAVGGDINKVGIPYYNNSVSIGGNLAKAANRAEAPTQK